MRLMSGLRQIIKPYKLDPRIPSPGLNYNQTREPGEDLHSYERNFKTRSCLREMPFLVKTCGLTSSSTFLDYGCGLGRVTYAASKFLGPSGTYFGYEPNQKALTFLRQAYGDLPNFHFYGEELPLAEDYVAIEQGDKRQSEARPPAPLENFVNRAIDCQWSSSVFTHMWIEPIVHRLREMHGMLSSSGRAVNTWLIVDDHAEYVLRCGMADRELPFKVNGAYTYSNENPLVCTAYAREDVKKMYESAGCVIEDILWGSWSGRDNHVTYQDIVISRPA